MKKFIAEKYQNMPRTPMGEVSENARKYNDVIDLSLGDPDLTTPDVIVQTALRDAQAGHTHYTEFLGDLQLREEISRFYKEEYQLDYSPAEIMAVVGGCHGMFLVLEGICNNQDEILIHSPFFTPYPLQIEVAGGTVVEVPTYESNGFQLTEESLKQKISDKTKALILNYPNNPTGAILSRESLEMIARVAIEKDLLIISDEIYTSFSFQEPFIPISSIEGMKDRTVIIGSFSKDYLMTGWRIGYVIGNEDLINTIRDINEGICFTAPSVSQRAAIAALKNRKKISPEIVSLYKNRVNYAYSRINDISKMSLLPPQATFYLFVNIKDTGLSSLEVCQRILDEAHVLVLPGSAFGASGEGYIRIACTCDIDVLSVAFDRIQGMSLFQQ